MAKEIEVQIIGEYCEDCRHATIIEESKSKVIVHCGARDKDYIWGKCVPCNDKSKII